MKIRKKTLLLVSLTLISLMTVILASVSTILLQSFRELEAENTQKNVQRVQEFMNEELSKLNLTSKDWARWDDTYFFVQGNSVNDYIEKNLYEDIFDNLKINLFLLYNKNHKNIINLAYDLETHQFTNFPFTLVETLKPESKLLKFNDDQGEIKGFLLIKTDLFLISSRPILTSEQKGPSAGILMMGRLINPARIEEIEQKTKLSLNITVINNLSSDLQSIFQDLINSQNPKQQILIKPINQEEIAGYSIIKDFENKPIALLEVKLNRDINKQGRKSIFFLIISLLIVGIVFLILMLVLIDKLIIHRLIILDHDLKIIGKTNNLSLRVKIIGKDELATFAKTINLMLDELQKEKDKTEKLLLNVLPESIAKKLKENNEIIAENYEDVTILFADLVGFTNLAGRLSPLELVKFLNHIFSNFDYVADKLGLEKIKTIGDAYMVASGLPKPRKDHAEAIAKMALEMNKIIQEISLSYNEKFEIRIGINTGKVIAGVIGTKKFIYDLWGDAVNIASRMESSGEAGKIQVTETTYKLLKDKFFLTKRGIIDVKGKGEMFTYWLEDTLTQT